MFEPAFTDEEARAAWNEGAQAWQQFLHSGNDYYRTYVHGPALLDTCRPLTGRRVLDLGCGEGYFSRELAREGAHVIAVDLSDELLSMAEAAEGEDPLGIEYHRMSAADVGGRWEVGSFDLVTGCMSLQDMSDIPAVLGGGAAVLGADGRLVFSVPHPGTDTPLRAWERDEHGRKLALKLGRYFDTGSTVCEWSMPRLAYPWATPYWRHTLTEWTAMTLEAGFLVRRLLEPRPTEADLAAEPNLQDCDEMPYFVIFDLVPAPKTE